MTTETTQPTQTPHLTDIRAIMLDQMKALRNASPEALESELKRSKAVSELSQTMINSAKVEIEYLGITNQDHSPFLETPPTVHTGNPPAPQLQHSQGSAGEEKATVTRTTWVDVAGKGKAK